MIDVDSGSVFSAVKVTPSWIFVGPTTTEPSVLVTRMISEKVPRTDLRLFARYFLPA